VDDDPRWITVDGRRWRASDPSIPPALRQELVDELMSARRSVAAAKRSERNDDVRRARARVHSAKVALGERGAPWWKDDVSGDDLVHRTEAVIDALTRHRAPSRSVTPSEVARVVDGRHWRRHLDLVRRVAVDMSERGVIEVARRGRQVVRLTHAADPS
jgi:Protein of unknown function (DUF3253)